VYDGVLVARSTLNMHVYTERMTYNDQCFNACVNSVSAATGEGALSD
jgi:hypothetical protein